MVSVPGTLISICGNGRAEALTVTPCVTAVGWSCQPIIHPPHTPYTSACPFHPPHSLLTHKHRTHTTHSTAAGAPLCGTGQRLAAISPHSVPGPSLPDGHSPATQGTFVDLPPLPLPPSLLLSLSPPISASIVYPSSLLATLPCSLYKDVAGLLAQGTGD